MSSLTDFHEKFGADAQLAEELILAAARRLNAVDCIVAALKATYGDGVLNGPDRDARLRESVRVLKALEAHGLMTLPEGMFT